jgi:hypothetical protein
MKIFTPERC